MNRTINRDNYEQYLIDYLDGNLDSKQIVDVELFLLNYPDIANEFEGINLTLIPAEKIEFKAKNDLKIQIKDVIPARFDSFDEFLAAYYEGDTSFAESKKMMLIIEDDDEKKKDFDLIFKTKLVADLSIKFPQKYMLKKSSILNMIGSNKELVFSLAAAAVLVVFFLFVRNNKDNSLNIEVAENPKSIINIDTPFKQIEIPQNGSIVNHEDEGIQIKKRILKNANKKVNLTDPDNLVIENIATNSKLPIQILKIEKQDIAFEENANQNNVQKPESALSNDSFSRNNKPNIIGQSYALNQYIYIQMRETLFGENRQESSTRKFSIWDIADAGIRRLGKTFDKDWNLQKSYNDSGALNSVAFNSKLLSFSVPLE